MLQRISSNSCHLNLLLVRSHQAETIIVKRFMQGCKNVTRLWVEPRLSDSRVKTTLLFSRPRCRLLYHQVITHFFFVWLLNSAHCFILKVEGFYVGGQPGIILVKICSIYLSRPNIILHAILKYIYRIDGLWLWSSSDRAVLRIWCEGPVGLPLGLLLIFSLNSLRLRNICLWSLSYSG